MRRHYSQPSPKHDNGFPGVLVTPAELNAALESRENSFQQSRVITLSSAWFLPNDPQQRTGPDSFRKHRVPGSRFFNLDEVCDKDSPWPHMLPSVAHFAKSMGLLGVKRSDCVVFFDTPELGLFSAPRAAWTLKHFGHPKVHVLNNFKLWVEQGLPVESGPASPANPETYEFSANELQHLAVDHEAVQGIIRSNLKGTGEAATILDARSFARWAGTAPEPRPGLPSGHMPSSISLPFTDLLDPKTKALLPRGELQKILESKVPHPQDNIISTCGTGVSASVVDLALEVAGWPLDAQRKVYDGSWTEWASIHKGGQDGWILKD